jgi:hypothetical protein
VKKLFSFAITAIAFGLVFTAFGCGRAASPADSIALGPARACADGGTWDGLECATPREPAPTDDPTPNDHSKPTSTKRKGTPLPPRQDSDCDCDPQDPLCSCE